MYRRPWFYRWGSRALPPQSRNPHAKEVQSRGICETSSMSQADSAILSARASHLSGSAGSEKSGQSLRSISWMLFEKKVAARHSAAFHLVAPLTPKRQEPAFRRVPLSQRTGRAPEGQHRAFNFTTRSPIFCIVLTIDRRCCAIFFANCVDVIRVGQYLDIGMSDLGRESRCRGTPTLKRLIDNSIGRADNEPLRQWRRLREQAPRPECQSETVVRTVPRVVGRDNIENCQLFDRTRMIERHSIGDTAAAAAQTTVNLDASNGAMSRHMRCVSGKPCKSSNGGPLPVIVANIDASDSANSSPWNRSGICQPRALRFSPLAFRCERDEVMKRPVRRRVARNSDRQMSGYARSAAGAGAQADITG